MLWNEILLYGFLGYVLLHLILDDLVYVYKSIYGIQNTRRLEVEPVGVHYGDIEMCEERLLTETVGNSNSATRKPMSIDSNEQRTLVLIFFKLCDIVMYCVMGYFKTFTTCWVATLDCLNSMISKYFAFLDTLVKCLTAAPAVMFLSVTAVLCLAITAVIVWIVMPSV